MTIDKMTKSQSGELYSLEQRSETLKPRLSLVLQALKIVLEHCMLPSLGWKTVSCERNIEILRNSIGPMDDENTLWQLQQSYREKLQVQHLIATAAVPNDNQQDKVIKIRTIWISN
jgi:hypothetical protein